MMWKHTLTALAVALATTTAAADAGSNAADPVRPETQLSLEKISGDGASGIFGSAIVPVVRVTRGGEPTASVPVRLTIASGGGSLADSVITTGADGTANGIWLLGMTEGMQTLRAVVEGDSVEFTAEAAAPVPGTSYLGRNDYIEYIPGELPIILSSPHDGPIRPDEIPDRERGTFARDLNTMDLTRRIAAALERITGKKPHVAISHLRRIKMDPNRAITNATLGDPYAMHAWHEYHTWLDVAGELVSREYGRGLHLDIHGHAHPIQRIELGYMLRNADLNRPDSELDREEFINKSSIRHFATVSPLSLSEIVRGEHSLGELLVRRGFPAIPSKSDPQPGDDPFWSHGYTLMRHGSRSGGTIDAIMLEHHRGLRQSAEVREAYANALADALVEFFQIHMGIDLRAAGTVE